MREKNGGSSIELADDDIKDFTGAGVEVVTPWAKTSPMARSKPPSTGSGRIFATASFSAGPFASRDAVGVVDNAWLDLVVSSRRMYSSAPRGAGCIP